MCATSTAITSAFGDSIAVETKHVHHVVGNVSCTKQVHVGGDTTRTYALKRMKKRHIVDTHQQEHVLNEKWTMSECRSDFIVR